ncbi:FUSC family protein [Brachybacterium alimentarium]|uniref:FUSC family protein n=1 Tax=Brachybacterium alimentarium TaxID=47845 RepID=UPI000DF1E4BF|nr:FUSC family protein [Brachybacterium alimentarium]RCS69546.1 FUSC family protein [Brachybacterium alimentarium]RCS88249.1 FUSC family protein [Brachybacterium alimentarium]
MPALPVQIQGTAQRMLSLGPRRVDHIPAFRIAVGLAIPMSVLLLTDHVSWAMYVGFGAFTGIYSRYEPTRMRFRRQALAGAMLTVCVTLGATLSSVGELMDPTAASWTTLLVSSVVAGLAAVLVLARGLKPGGAIFPLFAVAAVASAPPAAPVWAAFLVAAGAATLCVGLGLLGHWAGERHPAAHVDPGAERWTGAQLGAEFSRFAIASAVAGMLGLASGLPFPYWAQIAAIALLSAPGRTLQVERGLHRVIGTTLGIVTTAFLLSFPSEPWQFVVWVVVLQFLAEMYVLRNYAFALLFITPLALLMVQLAHPQPVGPMLEARVLETAIGVVVGIVVVVTAALADRHRNRSASASA